MGGARIAVVNDETALMVNPAGLGKLRDYFVTVADPELELGSQTQSIIEADLFAFTDAQKTVDLLEENPGKHLHQRAQIFPSFVVPNFGLGVYARYAMDAQADTTGTVYDMEYRNDYAIVTGFNFRLFDGRIKLGVSARITNRVEVSQTSGSATSTGLEISNLSSEGMGIGTDAGLILALPWKWLPTLAAVWRDVGGTRYNLTEGMLYDTSTRPRAVSSTIDTAFALFQIGSHKNRFTFTGELRDVLDVAEEEEIMRRVHVGFEYNLADAFFVRAGYHQRYWSAGVELSMLNYQLQLGSYGEDIGTPETPQEDRRYVGKFSFRF